MIVELYIGTDKVDLNKDEVIEVTSAVTTITDITKNITDYSKDFTVPASNRNNKIFKHYYNANIDNSFDARTKVDATIFIDGVTFKKGKVRLSKVEVEKGKPKYYTLNFWGNLLSLPKKLSDYSLAELDLSSFNHDLTSINIKEGLESSLFGGDIKYCLFPKRQYYYNSSTSDHVNSNNLVNIAYQGGSGSNGVAFNELRPSIKVNRIIDAIENDFNFTFSNDFFSRAEFDNLYLWLNNSDTANVGGDSLIIDFDSGDTSNVNLTTNIGSFDVSNTSASNDNYFYYLQLYINPSSGFNDIEYKVKCYKNGSIAKEKTYKGDATFTIELSTSGTGQDYYTHEVYFEIETVQVFKYEADLKQTYIRSGLVQSIVHTYASEQEIESVFKINEEVPDIKIIDFLKGLFRLNKLVIKPISDTEMYINTLNDYYKQGNLYDITKYIISDRYTVERGDLLNEINFKFKESDTILNNQFYNTNYKYYGNEEVKIYEDESNEELIDGDSLDYEVPFEQFVYERLLDINNNSETNIQYCAIIDDSLNSLNTAPHLHYIENVNIEDKPIGLINEDNDKIALNSTLNIPTHTFGLINPTHSTIFSQEYNEWNGELINNTLYTNYHKNYIENIFNIKRRNFVFTANLPFRILSKLDLNDVLKIGTDYYRIDNYRLDILTGKTTLNLITSFDTNLPYFKADTTEFYLDEKASIQSSYVVNLGVFSVNKIDRGFDTDWISVSSSSNIVYFSVAYNYTGFMRDMFIEITNVDTLQKILFYINQRGGTITVDNNIITADNSIITVDNG